MKRSHLSAIAIAFIIGILVARYTDILFFIFWTISFLTLILSILSLRSKRIFFFFSILSILFLGSLSFRNSQTLPCNHISNFTPYKGDSVNIEGIVDSDPILEDRSIAFILEAQRLIKDEKTQKACGKLLVKAFGKRVFVYGDRLLIQGKLYRVPNFSISKNLSYRRYLEQGHIYSILSVSKDSIVKVLGKNKGNPFKALAFYMRHRIKEIVADNMSSFSGSILSAVILGQRYRLPEGLREVMVQSGTIHIIAISGLHVGLVAFIVLMAFKVTRLPRMLCYMLTILVLIIYCLLTGAMAPVIRATIMAVMILMGYLIGRQTNVYNALSASALIILFFNPKQLFNISFQLSFMSMISLVGLSPEIKKSIYFFINRFLTGESEGLFKRSHLDILISLFSSSLAVWIGLSPLIIYYFNIISPVAILANLIVVPYLSIVVGSALSFILIGLVYQPLAFIFSYACEASIIILFKFLLLSVRIPGAYLYLPDISFSFVVSYYLFISTILLVRIFFGQKRKKALKIN